MYLTINYVQKMIKKYLPFLMDLKDMGQVLGQGWDI
jgi:hypothetical protein